MSSVMSTHYSYIKNIRSLNKSKIEERSISGRFKYFSVNQTLVKGKYRFASFRNFKVNGLISNNCPKYLFRTKAKETLARLL